MVMFRPGDALPTLGSDARVDLGLRAAAEELASAATTPDARLDPVSVRAALARSGYPGDARFLRVLGDRSLPASILDGIPKGAPVDVGWAWRDFPDGRRWWVLGWAPRLADLDPLPLRVALGRGVHVRGDGPTDPRLLVSDPHGRVRELSIEPGAARWVDGFDALGEYRLELLDGDRVALLFSLFVGPETPAPATLPGPAVAGDPMAAAEDVYRWIAELRSAISLPALTRWPAYEPLTREHAACVGALGVAAHRTEKCPGVVDLSNRRFFPRALHTEDVAVAANAVEAWDVMLASPGHHLNVACTDCTHVSVGAALEPAFPPRMVVVIELLSFPNGQPEPILKH
jgi:hypothetical protein